jgi:hypothetical protein
MNAFDFLIVLLSLIIKFFFFHHELLVVIWENRVALGLIAGVN